MENKEPEVYEFQSGDPEILSPESDSRNVVDDFRGVKTPEIREILRKSRSDFHVAIENISHDFNIGAIVRNANAFNAKSVHIIGKRHWNRRGAMKTETYLDIFHHKTAVDFLYWAKREGLKVIAIDNQKGAKRLSEAEILPSSIFVFGSEKDGISQEMLEGCQEMVEIEQFGSTRSVNVGVASGILMYEFVRRNILG